MILARIIGCGEEPTQALTAARQGPAFLMEPSLLTFSLHSPL